jgi:hypothetical protein
MSKRPPMKLYPWDECVAQIKERKQTSPGLVVVFQQWNCEHCGVKQTMDEPNTLYEIGRCEECNKTTNIKQNGMNYMITIGIPLP